MKKIWKSLLVGLSFIFLVGCSSMDTARVQEKSTISKEEKTILLPTGAAKLNMMLYGYFDDNGWKIFETTNNQTVETVKGTVENVQDRAVFSAVYSLTFVERNLLFQDLYNGYITMIDNRTGKTVTSLRFNKKSDNDIYKTTISEFEKNVIVK